ncbi:MAG: glycosyltransferase [Balneolales bacterium]
MNINSEQASHFDYMTGQYTEQEKNAKKTKPPGQIDISIVIVNYNVKEFVANLLDSIEKAQNNFNIEIFVVDNASSDGSESYLKRRYPKVNYIVNSENIGFGRANNQAIHQARGTYTLLINPDTIIRRDTLEVMVRHMKNHPETAAAGCKILNPDGSFAPESRRAVPTPLTALWKILGLSNLFPNSRRFSAYYLGGVDEDKESKVPVLSGAFMFFRTEILLKNQGFDERFFMYGEDIDLCYRIRETGWEIDYVPATSIIHYKGESTKKENLDYVVTFNKAIYQFFSKHYSFGYTLFFRIFILVGIVLKGVFSYLHAVFRKLIQPVLDITILNLLVILFFMWRYEISPTNIISQYHLEYLSVNVLLSSIYLVSALYYDLYGKRRFSIPSVIKSTGIAFTGVVVITFFIRNLAFSRLILLLSAITGVILLSVLRLVEINRSRNAPNIPGSFLVRRVLLVGLDQKTARLIRKLRSRADWNYQIVGIVDQNRQSIVDEVENVPVLGSLDRMLQLVRFHQVDEVIFMLHAVNHDQILKVISELRGTSVYPRIVPDSMDYIVGKTNVEYFDDIPVMDINLPYFSKWNLLLKRMLDLTVSSVCVIVMTPFFIFPILFNRRRRNELNIYITESKAVKCALFLPYVKYRWKNRYLFMCYVLLGRLSLVGSPVIPDREPKFANVKPGLTGFRQLSENRLYHEDEKLQHELFYLQNYTIWMDLDIILKTLIYRRKSLESIDSEGSTMISDKEKSRNQVRKFSKKYEDT